MLGSWNSHWHWKIQKSMIWSEKEDSFKCGYRAKIGQIHIITHIGDFGDFDGDMTDMIWWDMTNSSIQHIQLGCGKSFFGHMINFSVLGVSLTGTKNHWTWPSRNRWSTQLEHGGGSSSSSRSSRSRYQRVPPLSDKPMTLNKTYCNHLQSPVDGYPTMDNSKKNSR